MKKITISLLVLLVITASACEKEQNTPSINSKKVIDCRKCADTFD